MSLSNFSREQVESTVRGVLEENFPLYDEKHSIHQLKRPNKIWIGYRTSRAQLKSTRFDLELFELEGHLEYIEIDESQRGKGHGWRLYESIHEIARRLGCIKMVQTPKDGFELDGKMIKLRADYLKERGYKETEEGTGDLEFIL